MEHRLECSGSALWFATTVPLLLLYLFTLRVNPSVMGIDTISVTSSAWQLAHHGTPRLPATAHYYDWFMIPSGPGQVISNREPGLIGLAAVVYRIFPDATIYNLAPASLAAAVVTSAAMGTLALVLRQLVSPRAALVASLIAGTATTTWTVSGTSLWPHGPDQLYLTIAMLGLATGRNVRSGVAFALALLTRPPLGIVAAITGIWSSVTRRSLRPAVIIGCLTACGLAGFLAYSYTFWGGGLQSQYTAATPGSFVGNFFDLRPKAIGAFGMNILGAVISPGRGVLFGSPFLVTLVPGIRQAWRVAPAWARSCAVGGLVYMCAQLKANYFAGGGHFWSYRYPIAALTLFTPLFVFAWREYVSHTARRRAVFASMVIAAIAFQALGSFCFGVNWYFSDWLPYNVAWAIREKPVAGSLISLGGYVAAAVAYRVVYASARQSAAGGHSAEVYEVKRSDEPENSAVCDGWRRHTADRREP